jgi:small subunit ribosomal protein S21
MVNAVVYVEPGEHIDVVLRRFKKTLNATGMAEEHRVHRYARKPSVKRRAKSDNARRRYAAACAKADRFYGRR